MADQTVRIIFQSVGADKVVSDVAAIGESSKKSAVSLDTLTGILQAGFGSVLLSTITNAVKKFADMSDEFTILRNRIAVTTDSNAEAVQTFTDLTDVAQLTRQSISQVGDAYEHVRIAADDLGISQQQAVTVTDTLLETFTAVSGSSSNAAAAVRQLSQALGEGTLTGREFRSILGNNPFLANELAKALNLTTAQFRDLGAAGNLSARQLVNAFEEAAPQIDAIFKDKITPTINGQFTNIGTSFSQIVNNAVGSGFAQTLAHNFNIGLRQIGGLDQPESPDAQALRANQQQLLAAQLAAQQAQIPTALNGGESDNQKQYLASLQKQLLLQQSIASVTLQDGDDAAASLRVQQGLTDKHIISQQHANDLLADGKTTIDLWNQGYTVLDNLTYSNLTSIAETTRLLQLGRQLVSQYGTDSVGIIEKQKELNALIDGQITKEQFMYAQRDLAIQQLQHSFDAGSGFRRGLLEVGQQVNDFASQSEKAVTDAFGGMEDTIANFVTTGKLDFSDLVNSVLADLTKLLLRQTIEAPLFSALSSFLPGLNLGGPLPTGTPHADGGAVTAGTAYKVGERGPETFVPSQSGYVVPNGGNTPPPAPIIHVTNVVDKDSILDAVYSDPKSQQRLINIIGVNKRSIKSQLGIA